jgi:prepilin-type N-terminal cleavage/methylation domain-containing protein
MMRRFLHPNRRARRGMVLFELMIALTIFSVVAFSLVMALDAAFDAAKDRNQLDTVIRGLENQMALLHASRVLPEDVDLPDDGSGITYHLTVEPAPMQDQKKQPVFNMYRATVTATWKSDGQPDDRSLTQLFYQP